MTVLPPVRLPGKRKEEKRKKEGIIFPPSPSLLCSKSCLREKSFSPFLKKKKKKNHFSSFLLPPFFFLSFMRKVIVMYQEMRSYCSCPFSIRYCSFSSSLFLLELFLYPEKYSNSSYIPSSLLRKAT